MTLNLSWVPEGHQHLAGPLVEEIAQSCAGAEKSKAFIDLQLNPKAEWKGWPSEVAETWLATNPKVVASYFGGKGDVETVGRALRKRLRDVYRPSTGKPLGRPTREPREGIVVPDAVAEVLDTTTWDVMRKFGSQTDLTAIRQLVKVPSATDVDGDDKEAVIQSAGTVREEALAARYTAIRGDLYWSDIRNNLELFIRARPELIDSYNEWAAKGSPRAWEEGGEWIVRGENDRREANPLIRIRAGAHKRAAEMVSKWKREGHLSYEDLADGDFDAVQAVDGTAKAMGAMARPKAQRSQHKPLTGHEHYAWGLRDQVDCYSFPVVVSVMAEQWP
jgi:hypothetical protein